MLYDPKWNKQPSLEGFIAWLETKDPTETYNWGDTEACACAQYAATLGLVNAYGRTKGQKIDDENPNTNLFEVLNWLALSADYARTKNKLFGSLLDHARAELAKTLVTA